MVKRAAVIEAESQEGVEAVLDLKELPAVIPQEATAMPALQSTNIDPYQGLSIEPFEERIQRILDAPVDPNDVEIRPDKLIYLPEIKYRKMLNTAFGRGGWGVQPRSAYQLDEGTTADGKPMGTLSREYALYALGRFVAEARGEQDYFPNNGNMSYASASEGVKSNAIVRCCKDIGIAWELWDPGFIEGWISKYAVQVWCGQGGKPQWRRKDRAPFWNETGLVQPKQTEQKQAVDRQAEAIVMHEEKTGTKPSVDLKFGDGQPAKRLSHAQIELKALVEDHIKNYEPELKPEQIYIALTKYDSYQKKDSKGELLWVTNPKTGQPIIDPKTKEKIPEMVLANPGQTKIELISEKAAGYAIGKYRKMMEQHKGKAVVK